MDKKLLQLLLMTFVFVCLISACSQLHARECEIEWYSSDNRLDEIVLTIDSLFKKFIRGFFHSPYSEATFHCLISVN